MLMSTVYAYGGRVAYNLESLVLESHFRLVDLQESMTVNMYVNDKYAAYCKDTQIPT